MPAVLGFALILEGASLVVAIRSLSRGATIANLSFWEFINEGRDPTSTAVMMEDGAAVTGLVIAGTRTAFCLQNPSVSPS